MVTKTDGESPRDPAGQKASSRLRAGQTLPIRATGLSASGDGWAQLPDAGQVHVAGLLPGESALVRILHVAKQARRGHGKILELQQVLAERREPLCKHHGRCAGCPLMVAGEHVQRQLKSAMLEQSFGLVVDEIVAAAAQTGYRWASKRVVGGRRGALLLGSYSRRSHNLADMSDCVVDHSDIAACAREVQRLGSELGIVPYDESSHEGDLRYVWLKTDGAGRTLVTLVSAFAQSRVAELATRLEQAAGVAWAVQSDRGNAMRGATVPPGSAPDDVEVTVLQGQGTLTVELAGCQIQVGPLGFLQPNPRVAERAYDELTAEQSGGLAFDLYAGSGVTTALLGRGFEQVRSCEAFPESAAQLGVAPETAADFLARVIEGEPPSPAPSLIVANPPRAGMGAEVCKLLNRLASERVHLMSCSPAALRRDLDRLLEPNGRYRLCSVRAFDTLPQTAHVELVAKLQRSSS